MTADARTRRLRALLADWRADAIAAGQFSVGGGYMDASMAEGQAIARTACADELAAVLDAEGDRPPRPSLTEGERDELREWLASANPVFLKTVLAAVGSDGDQPTPLGKELLTWERAARILGEALSTNGPIGYYQFGPVEWLNWARATVADTEGDRPAQLPCGCYIAQCPTHRKGDASPMAPQGIAHEWRFDTIIGHYRCNRCFARDDGSHGPTCPKAILPDPPVQP